MTTCVEDSVDAMAHDLLCTVSKEIITTLTEETKPQVVASSLTQGSSHVLLALFHSKG